MQAMEISRTGLDVEWRRLEIIAENLANVNTVRTGGSGPYKALHLISGPKSDFASYLQRGSSGPDLQNLAGVTVYSIEADNAAPRLVHEPGNPQADAQGYVPYPNIDHAEEMTLMVKTSRAYEANIVAINAAREMYSKALELGRNA
jgi:flagellar basal-body rod protein FlgC